MEKIDRERAFIQENSENSVNSAESETSIYINLSDVDIWKMFKSGNESAFIHIYRKYFKSLVNYGLQIYRDKELVKDAIQDMFIELRMKRKSVLTTDKIRPFLNTLLRRRILKYIGKSNGTEHLGQNLSEYGFLIELSPEQRMINKQLDEETIRQLNKAISRLTKNEREIIYLFYFEKHSYEEIADIMELKKIKSARNLLYKALAALRENMNPQKSALFFMLF
ncbi:MAG: sigma-70 family RNA polymerase sigma factor [Cyclobacteriaceae bacterium]|nr:sigma-70 family RNA polymerase sigma factor [Cyclobacteriaceae bacterium]